MGFPMAQMIFNDCKLQLKLQNSDKIIWPFWLYMYVIFCSENILTSLTLYIYTEFNMWTASSEFGTYRLCEQRRFRRACASAQSRQNLRCSLIQAVSQEEPSNRKPDPWPLWMAGHAQLKFVMTECSKTQIHLTGLMYVTVNPCITVKLIRNSNLYMGPVKRKCVFECLRPVKIQTSLLSYRD